ncbi:MAG: hypothetical protein AAFY56_03495 [Pseudomonadota bacterium]
MGLLDGVLGNARANEKLFLMNQANEKEIVCKVVEVDDDWLEDDDPSNEIAEPTTPNVVPTNAETRAANPVAQTINLDSIRHAMGDKWPSAEARAMKIAQVTLQAQLSPSDRLLRTKDNNFEIIFGQLSPEVAAQRAHGLTNLVNSKLAGDRVLADPIAATSADIEGQASSGKPSDDLTKRLQSTVNKRAEFVQAETERTLQELRDQAKVVLAPVLANGNRRSVNLRLVSFDRPWASKVEYLRSLHGDAETIQFEVDLTLYGVAANQLMQSVDPTPSRFSVPVNYSTIFEPPLANKFLEFCRNIPDDLREKIILNVSGIDGDDMLSPWAESSLECHSRLRMIQIRDLNLPLDLASERIGIVNMEFSDIEGQLWSERNHIRELVREVQAANCRFLISEIPNEFLTVARDVKPDLLSLRGDHLARF